MLNQPGTGGIPNAPRVAFLNADLWMGGSAVFSLTLGSELLRHDIPTEVFSMHTVHTLEPDFVRNRLRVSRAPKTEMIFEDRMAATLHAIRQFAPNVVIANLGFDPFEVLRYLPPGVLRVGVAHAAHAPFLECIDRYGLWIDWLVGVSTEFEKVLKASLKFPQERIVGIDLGVRVPKAPRERSFSGGEPLRILYLGRLENPAKRVRLFPQIYRRLCESGIPFQWTIAGEGPERAYLQREMISRPPKQKVTFAGSISFADVPEVLGSHDIILLTSDSETFSLSLHEAMAAGLVPVTSDIPGRVREAVTKETGCRVPPEQTDSYAAAIAWLHEHRDVMEKMSQASHKMISDRYSIEAMGRRWVEFIDSRLPVVKPIWPERWTIESPYLCDDSYRFRAPWRAMRRLGAKARRIRNALWSGSSQ